MTLMEAINNVCIYLHRQQIVFTLYRAWQIAEAHFRVAVHQVKPEDKLRAFDIVATDVADCWNIVEVEVNGND